MTTPGAGAAMFQHLQEVHGYFRGQLAALRRAADDDAPAAALVAAAGAFTPSGAGGDLRLHCMYFCHALTMHHSIEDSRMFPGMRAAHPEAAPVLDRLEAEHHVVAELVEKMLVLLSSVPAGGSTPALRDALRTLSDELTAHLDYEESVLEPLFGP